MGFQSKYHLQKDWFCDWRLCVKDTNKFQQACSRGVGGLKKNDVVITSKKDIVIGSCYAEDMNKFQQALARGLGSLKIKKIKKMLWTYFIAWLCKE